MNSYDNIAKPEFKMLEYPECVHLTERGRCNLLKTPECAGKKCTLKETKADKHESHNLWRSRMSKLPQERQDYFSKKYYGGHYPWKE